MVIKIYANDGTEFKGSDYPSLVNELNVYETDQKLRKQKEQEERAKAVAKAEAEKKAKEEKLTELKQKISVKSKELDDLLDEYEKVSGTKYYYYYTGNNYSFPVLLNEFINRYGR